MAHISQLTTRNADWGFFGTMAMKGIAQEAWDVALAGVSEATGYPKPACVKFLDSNYGRHFANEVDGLMEKGETLEAAVAATAKRWMEMQTKRSRNSVMKAGRPYLKEAVSVMNYYG